MLLQEVVAEKGVGSWVWTADGNKYLDMTSGNAVYSMAWTIACTHYNPGINLTLFTPARHSRSACIYHNS